MAFSTLPLEIYHSIFVHLNHKSLLNRTSTNLHFQSTRNPSVLRLTLLITEPKLLQQLASRPDSPLEG